MDNLNWQTKEELITEFIKNAKIKISIFVRLKQLDPNN
jgi:hypothetical protein